MGKGRESREVQVHSWFFADWQRLIDISAQIDSDARAMATSAENVDMPTVSGSDAQADGKPESDPAER